jgi:flavodoxin I
MMKKALIVYVSISGNTQEMAQLIERQLTKENILVDSYWVGEIQPFPSVKDYDMIFIGTYTWHLGATPDELKDFIIEVGYKPKNVYIFGSGDSQFGREYFCMACDKLKKFYDSEVEPLKIEQSPRGYQEEKVKEWVKGVLTHEKIKQSQDFRTKKSK